MNNSFFPQTIVILATFGGLIECKKQPNFLVLSNKWNVNEIQTLNVWILLPFPDNRSRKQAKCALGQFYNVKIISIT